MRVQVVRDEDVAIGGSSWVQLSPDELVFVVSAHGMTDVGARALQAAWSAFIDAGVWRWREAGGEPIGAIYHRTTMPPGEVVEILTRPGVVDVWLSAAHFCWATVNSLQASARDCVKVGWSYHPLRAVTAA